MAHEKDKWKFLYLQKCKSLYEMNLFWYIGNLRNGFRRNLSCGIFEKRIIHLAGLHSANHIGFCNENITCYNIDDFDRFFISVVAPLT